MQLLIDHETGNQVRMIHGDQTLTNYLSGAEVKRRGWRQSDIKTLMPTPCKTAPNPYNPKRTMGLYSEDRVNSLQSKVKPIRGRNGRGTDYNAEWRAAAIAAKSETAETDYDDVPF